MLEVSHLYSGYPSAPDIIKDVSFSIQDAQMVCIIGPNGCGKTTLLRAIDNLIDSRGEIVLYGRDVKTYPRRELSQHVAMLSQITAVYFPYTVYETVMLGRYAHQKQFHFFKPAKQDVEIVHQCMKAVGIGELKDTPTNLLSGGQLQRVHLARVAAQKPKLLLLDEPTNHLDFQHQLSLLEFLSQWCKQQGIMVLAVLHDMNLALSFADKLLLMKEGQLVAFDTCDAVLKSGLLNEVSGVDVAAYMRRALNKWQAAGDGKP